MTTPIDNFVNQCRPWMRMDEHGVASTGEDYVLFSALLRLAGLLELQGQTDLLTTDEAAEIWHAQWWRDNDIDDVINAWHGVQGWLERNPNPLVEAHRLADRIEIKSRLSHQNMGGTRLAAGELLRRHLKAKAENCDTFSCSRREIALVLNKWVSEKGKNGANRPPQPDPSAGKSKFQTLQEYGIIARVNNDTPRPQCIAGQEGPPWAERSEWKWILTIDPEEEIPEW